MNTITFEQVAMFAVVLFVVINAYNTIMTAVEHYKKSKDESPTSEMSLKIEAHDKMLAADKIRIERLEAESAGHNREMKLILKSQMALLRHGIDGNNIDGLKDSQSEINEFLLEDK